MRMYLSSEGLGDYTDELMSLWPDNGRIGVIANATDGEPPEIREEHVTRQLVELATLGLTPEEIDLRRYFESPSNEIERRIGQNYGGLWVPGGNVFVLRQAMGRSSLDRYARPLLEGTGLVYAGYSAGSCQTAPDLHGLELVDDANEVPPEYHRVAAIFEGSGLLDKLIVPHFRSPNNGISPLMEPVVADLRKRRAPHILLRDGDVVTVRDGKQQILRQSPLPV